MTDLCDDTPVTLSFTKAHQQREAEQKRANDRDAQRKEVRDLLIKQNRVHLMQYLALEDAFYGVVPREINSVIPMAMDKKDPRRQVRVELVTYLTVGNIIHRAGNHPDKRFIWIPATEINRNIQSIRNKLLLVPQTTESYNFSNVI